MKSPVSRSLRQHMNEPIASVLNVVCQKQQVGSQQSWAGANVIGGALVSVATGKHDVRLASSFCIQRMRRTAVPELSKDPTPVAGPLHHLDTVGRDQNSVPAMEVLS